MAIHPKLCMLVSLLHIISIRVSVAQLFLGVQELLLLKPCVIKHYS